MLSYPWLSWGLRSADKQAAQTALQHSQPLKPRSPHSAGLPQAAAGKGAGRLARIGAILRVIGADAGEPERVARAGAAVGRLQGQLGELAAQQPRLAAQVLRPCHAHMT